MNNPFRIIALIIIFAALISCKKEYTLMVGGFTKKNGEKGMSVFKFNARNGDLKLLSESDVGPSPSYFCFSKKDSLFYVNNEVMQFRGSFGGGLSTFRYDPMTHEFSKQNELLIPYGGPCFISMSSDSGYLFLANYPNGSVAVVKLNKRGIPESISDTILYMKDEPDASHAHMILEDPSATHVYVTDLGLDRIRYFFSSAIRERTILILRRGNFYHWKMESLQFQKVQVQDISFLTRTDRSCI